MNDSAWLPMEEAPKDGTPILGGRGKKVWSCRYWTPDQIGEAGGEPAHNFAGGWYELDDWHEEAYPAKWMPWPGEATSD